MPLYLPATGLHLAAPPPSRSESDSRLTNRHERGKEERAKPSSGGGISQSGYNTIETLGVNYVVSKLCQEYKDFFLGVFNCKVLHRYYYLEDTHKKMLPNLQKGVSCWLKTKL